MVPVSTAERQRRQRERLKFAGEYNKYTAKMQVIARSTE